MHEGLLSGILSFYHSAVLNCKWLNANTRGKLPELTQGPSYNLPACLFSAPGHTHRALDSYPEVETNPLPGHRQWREGPSQGNLSHQISDFPPGDVPIWATATVNRERHLPKATHPTKSLVSILEMFLSWAMALPTNMVLQALELHRIS